MLSRSDTTSTSVTKIWNTPTPSPKSQFPLKAPISIPQNRITSKGGDLSRARQNVTAPAAVVYKQGCASQDETTKPSLTSSPRMKVRIIHLQSHPRFPRLWRENALNVSLIWSLDKMMALARAPTLDGEKIVRLDGYFHFIRVSLRSFGRMGIERSRICIHSWPWGLKD